MEPERIGMFNLSSVMAYDFAALTQQMVKQIRAIGPNPLRNDG